MRRSWRAALLFPRRHPNLELLPPPLPVLKELSWWGIMNCWAVGQRWCQGRALLSIGGVWEHRAGLGGGWGEHGRGGVWGCGKDVRCRMGVQCVGECMGWDGMVARCGRYAVGVEGAGGMQGAGVHGAGGVHSV